MTKVYCICRAGFGAMGSAVGVSDEDEDEDEGDGECDGLDKAMGGSVAPAWLWPLGVIVAAEFASRDHDCISV